MPGAALLLKSCLLQSCLRPNKNGAMLCRALHREVDGLLSPKNLQSKQTRWTAGGEEVEHTSTVNNVMLTNMLVPWVFLGGGQLVRGGSAQ